MNRMALYKKKLKLRITDQSLFECFLVMLVTSVLTFGWFIWESRGFFTVCDDYMAQVIPFSIAMNRSLKAGLDTWAWNIDLGTSAIQAFSYYGYGSPFLWITLPFPAASFPYLAGVICCLKYITAGVTAFCYIRRFVRNQKLAIIGCLLYAFSGFQAMNLIFYIFHDVTAFFPLLLIGLDRMMEDRSRKGLFIFSVFLNCLVNYFFFVQEVVFLVIYFLIRYWDRPGFLLRRIALCVSCGLLGVGMASALFLPSVLYITQSSRSVRLSLEGNLIYDLWGLLKIAAGSIFPAVPMNDYSAIMRRDYASTSNYLPFVNLSLVIAYLLHRMRNWLKNLIIVLLVMSLSPLLNSAFLLFTAAYQRWWYMLILMEALASAEVLDDIQKYDVRRGILINATLCIAIYLVVGILPAGSGEKSLVFHPGRWLLYLIYALVCLAILWLIIRMKSRQMVRALTVMAAASCAITTGAVLKLYRQGDRKYTDGYKTAFELSQKLPQLDRQYRYLTRSEDFYLAPVGGIAGTNSFTSTKNVSIDGFQELFGFYSPIWSMDKSEIPYVRELIGAKYHVSATRDESQRAVADVSAGGKNYRIYEREACLIGFPVGNCIRKSELMRLKQEDRAKALLSSAEVADQVEDQLPSYMNRVTADTVDLSEPDAQVKRNTENAVTDFVRGYHGFTCTSHTDHPTAIWFSVPYDRGWEVRIDHQKAEVIESAGMMLLPVESGEHAIEFRYHTPGFREGLIISIISWTIFVCGISGLLRKDCPRNKPLRYERF